MRNTALLNVPVPGLDDPPNVPLHLGTVADTIETYALPRFANAADRDAKWTAPPDGAACVLIDTNTLMLRRAGAWVPVGSRIVSRTSGQSTIGAAYNAALPINVSVLWLSGSTDGSGILNLDITAAGLLPVTPASFTAVVPSLVENGDSVYGFVNFSRTGSTLTNLRFRFFGPAGTAWASRVVYYFLTLYWQ